MLGSALPPEVRRGLCPAVDVPFISWGYALACGLWPNRSQGPSPNQEQSPGQSSCCRRGKPRFTSGGTAVAGTARTFRATPLHTQRMNIERAGSLSRCLAFVDTMATESNRSSSLAPVRVCFVSLQARGAFVGGSGAKLGGTETQIRILAEYLSKTTTCDVHLLVEDSGQPPVEVIHGVTLHKVEQPDKGSGLAGVRRKVVSTRNLFDKAVQVNADVYVQQCSGVETALTARAARRANAGFVYMMASDSEVVPPWSRGGGLTERSFRWGLRRADVVTVQHAEQLANVARIFGRSAIEMPNVFEFSESTNESEGIARSGALWVGRARRLKGPHHFLELARRLPQFQFTLVALPTETEPDFARELEAQANSLSNVEFYPGLDPKQLVSIYWRRAVLVNTSDYEGLPNTFIEAAANGLALASLRVDPGGMFAQERAGVAADGDMDRLTNLLRELLMDEVGRTRWAERAREFLKSRHNLQEVGPRFIELLRLAARIRE